MEKAGKVKGPLFRIPIIQRCTETEPGVFMTQKVIVMDGVGVFVKFRGEPPAPEDLRRYLMCRKATFVLVEAQSLAEAVKQFYEWEGAKAGGGQGPESFAMWIDATRPIIRLPDCENLHYDHRGRFICGPETMENGEPTGNGEFGCCVLDGFDPPEECPIEDFYKWLSDFEGEYSHGEPFFTFRRVARKAGEPGKWFSSRWKEALSGKCTRTGCRTNTGKVNSSYCPDCRKKMEKKE